MKVASVINPIGRCREREIEQIPCLANIFNIDSPKFTTFSH